MSSLVSGHDHAAGIVTSSWDFHPAVIPHLDFHTILCHPMWEGRLLLSLHICLTYTYQN